MYEDPVLHRSDSVDCQVVTDVAKDPAVSNVGIYVVEEDYIFQTELRSSKIDRNVRKDRMSILSCPRARQLNRIESRDMSTHRDMVKGTLAIYQSTQCQILQHLKLEHYCPSVVACLMLHNPHVCGTVPRERYKLCAKFPCHVDRLKHDGNYIYHML